MSTFLVSGMDCPSEERLIRMALDGLSGIGRLEFYFAERRLEVWHHGTNRAWPDFVVGAAVALLLLWGASRILRLPLHT